MTGEFRRWLNGLRDRLAYRRIVARIERLAHGNIGLHRVLAPGVGELKVDHGPGYRLYFLRKGDALVILLSGGDKRMAIARMMMGKAKRPSMIRMITTSTSPP